MAALDSVPGAGLLVDETHTIVDGNVRAEIVFREDLDELCGTQLDTFRECNLFSDTDLSAWQDQLETVLTDDAASGSTEITLTPDGSEDRYVYELRVMPAEEIDDTKPELACCSFRSVGTSQRYEETVTALHEATRQFMTADEIEGVLRRTATAAHEVLGFPGTSVRRHDPEDNLLEFVSFGARVNNIQTRPPFSVDDSPHGDAFRSQETVIDDIGDDDPYGRDAFTQCMYIPIGETGTLSIGTVGNRFDEIDVQFGEILAENAAAAIRAVETKTSLRRERERLDRFASAVSHDLRNPLEVAQMYLDLAERTGNSENFEAAKDALDRMDQIIDDLLTMARADSELNRAESVRLAPLVEESWETVATSGAVLDSRIPEGSTVSADPTLLQNVFENLFRNAVEHAVPDEGSAAESAASETDRSGEPPVTVTVGVLDQESGLYVADDGQGIPGEERSSVFDHGYSTDSEGTGFGLSIVETLVEAHDWSVSVTESEDGGARFEIDCRVTS